jgi:hypothetical protein
MFTWANLFKNIMTVQSRLCSTGNIYEIRTNTGTYKITGTAKLHSKITRKVSVNTYSGSLWNIFKFKYNFNKQTRMGNTWPISAHAI